MDLNLSLLLWVCDDVHIGGYFGQLDSGLLVAQAAQRTVDDSGTSLSMDDYEHTFSMDDYVHTFFLLDINEDGAVSASEAHVLYETEEVDVLFTWHDQNSDGHITWAEYSGHS